MRHPSAWIVPIVLAAVAAPASACTVPVFRFALEMWLPDPYAVIVLHRGELEGDAVKAVELLSAQEAEHDPDRVNPRANTHTFVADLDGEATPEAFTELWEALDKPDLPVAVMKYPVSTVEDVWRWGKPGLEDIDGALIAATDDVLAVAALTPDKVRPLLRSRARDEVTRRLAKGDSGVWVLIESGDAEADAAAWKLLNDRLDVLAQELELPEVSDRDRERYLSEGPEAPPLHIKFSTMRLKHDDPAEAVFINSMLKWPKIWRGFDIEAVEGPKIAPLYGRGRIHTVLTGEELEADAIDWAAAFLVGMCSCEIKGDNPGIDLITTADWNHFTGAAAPATQPTGAAAPPATQPAAVPPATQPAAGAADAQAFIGPAPPRDGGTSAMATAAAAAAPAPADVSLLRKAGGIAIGLSAGLGLGAVVYFRQRRGCSAGREALA